MRVNLSISITAVLWLASILGAGAGEEEISRWIKELDADRLEERESAQRRLEQAGESAREWLEKAASDSSPERAERARKALACLESQRAFDWHREFLADPGLQSFWKSLSEADSQAHRLLADVDVWKNSNENEVVQQLRRADGPAPFPAPAWRYLLRDSREPVEALALEKLGQLKDSQSLSVLVAHARAHPRLSGDALRAVSALGTPEAARELSGFLKDPDPRLRCAVIDLFASLKAYLQIQPLLKDPDPSVRSRATKAFLMGSVDWESMTGLLDDPSIPLELQQTLVKRLLMAGKEKPLSEQADALLKSQDPFLSAVGLMLVSKCDGMKCEPRLREALQASEKDEARAKEAVPDDLRRKIEELPRQIEAGGMKIPLPQPQFEESLRQKVRSKRQLHKYAASYAAGMLGCKESIPDLVAIVKNPDESPGVRCAAIYALELLEAKESRGAIAGALSDENPSVRAQALHALARMGNPGDASAILEILKGVDEGNTAEIDIAVSRFPQEKELWEGMCRLQKRKDEAAPPRSGKPFDMPEGLDMLGLEVALRTWKSFQTPVERLCIRALEGIAGETRPGSWQEKRKAWLEWGKGQTDKERTER